MGRNANGIPSSNGKKILNCKPFNNQLQHQGRCFKQMSRERIMKKNDIDVKRER